MEQKSNRIYAEMPPVRLFFHAALPGAVSMFAMSVYSIIEGIFVGQFVGGDAGTVRPCSATLWCRIFLLVVWFYRAENAITSPGIGECMPLPGLSL